MAACRDLQEPATIIGRQRLPVKMLSLKPFNQANCLYYQFQTIFLASMWRVNLDTSLSDMEAAAGELQRRVEGCLPVVREGQLL